MISEILTQGNAASVPLRCITMKPLKQLCKQSLAQDKQWYITAGGLAGRLISSVTWVCFHLSPVCARIRASELKIGESVKYLGTVFKAFVLCSNPLFKKNFRVGLHLMYHRITGYCRSGREHVLTNYLMFVTQGEGKCGHEFRGWG